MTKLKYLLIIFIFFLSISKIEAIDIQYGSIKGYTNYDVLVEYYGIEKKLNYICKISTLKCSTTKKTTIGKSSSPIFKNAIKKEITDNNANHVTLSKSGKWLSYYMSAKEGIKYKTYVIKNIETNINYTNSYDIDYWDIINEQKKIFEFSPDDRTLIYLDNKDIDMSLYKVDLQSLKNSTFEGIKINVTAYSVSNFIYYDSNNIYYIGNDKENHNKWSLYYLDLKTGKDKIIESYVSYVDSIYKIGNSLIFTSLQEKGYGPEMYNVKTKKFSFFKVPNISTKKIITNEEYIKIGNSTGILMTPSKYDAKKSYPLLIWLHGGPLRQTSLGYHPYHSYGIYDAMLKLLQKNNVIVLKLDYRGSLGNGRIFSEAIKGSVGKGDIDDVMGAIKKLKDEYKINNIYLAGNSYGGYMALRTVVEYPESIKGVFSINGVTDWESLLVKMQTSIFNTEFNGLPNSENRNLYDQASIIDKINNLGNQRIEIIQAEADRTIPLWQATLLNNKLKDAGKNVNLVTYKGEDHVYKYKKNIGDICTRLFGLVGLPADKECTK